MAGVRADAPWCPWNIEFIRRVNGLDDVEEVCADRLRGRVPRPRARATSTSALPWPPRSTRATAWSRRSTTRRGRGRRRTPSASAAPTCASTEWRGRAATSSSGARRQVWSRFRRTGPFAEKPYLLRFFDRICWYPVQRRRAARAAGRHGRRPARAGDPEEARSRSPTTWSSWPSDEDSIAAFRARQAAAFGAERAAWAAAGEFDPAPRARVGRRRRREVAVPAGGDVVEAPCTASVWRVEVAPGDGVSGGDRAADPRGDEDGDGGRRALRRRGGRGARGRRRPGRIRPGRARGACRGRRG